ncbi:MAG: aminoacetone oxidase family FAD-binding enzyme, partial [Christensenellales bacterium]
MKLFDVAVIGGGASGCVVAFLLAKNGKNVCVIDKNESLASKLLVTGNGRCNITNENMCSDFYNTNIDMFLKRFDNSNTKQFFADLGVEIYADDEGRCYPVSNTAKSVVFAINNALQNQSVTSFCGSEVLKVERQNSGYKITTQTNTINAKKIVFACGYNKNITNILNDLNIKYKNYTPSLVALKTKQSTKRLDGLRISGAKVTAVCDGIVKTQTGEVLFKKDGISGICVFNLSALFSRKNNFDGKIAIDIFPAFTQDYLQNILQSAKTNYKTVFDLLLAN